MSNRYDTIEIGGLDDDGRFQEIWIPTQLPKMHRMGWTGMQFSGKGEKYEILKREFYI